MPPPATPVICQCGAPMVTLTGRAVATSEPALVLKCSRCAFAVTRKAVIRGLWCERCEQPTWAATVEDVKVYRCPVCGAFRAPRGSPLSPA